MSARRDVVFVMNEFRFSERRACGLPDIYRSSYRYEARPDHDEQLSEALVELARQKGACHFATANTDSGAVEIESGGRPLSSQFVCPSY